MPNQGTESQFEETTIDRLHALGYRYQYGGDIERDWREVVMKDWLRAFLQKKYPHEEEPNTLGAFNQVQHYKAGISPLFDYNALVVVSDGGMVGHADDDTPHAVGSTLHGMWTAAWEWFAPWKSINGREIVDSATGAMKTLIEGLFPKDRLLDYLRHFIAFEVVNEKIEKKGAKYHQFFGVRFAVQEALRATRPNGDRKLGVIWHAQGSGKSLSMA